MNNLFADLPATLHEEWITVLAENRHVRIERIVSTGQASAENFWYEQSEHEWVVVLKGAATLLFEDNDESLRLVAGDHVLIAAGRRHRVQWTSPDGATVWLAVFFRDQECADARLLEHVGSKNRPQRS